MKQEPNDTMQRYLRPSRSALVLIHEGSQRAVRNACGMLEESALVRRQPALPLRTVAPQGLELALQLVQSSVLVAPIDIVNVGLRHGRHHAILWPHSIPC